MDFNIIYPLYKKDIEQLCKSVVNNTNNFRVEFDDMVQESSLKLLQLCRSNKTMSKSSILIAIKNHLLNTIRNFKVDALYNADSLENNLGAE